MATRSIEYIISARDGFTPTANRVLGTLGRMQRSAGQLGRGVGQLGAGLERLAFIGIAAVGSQVALGIRSLEELSALTAQTEAVIRSTGGAAGLTARDIRGLAEAYEDLTTIDDKAIQHAQNILLTFPTLGKKAFRPALEAVLDLSTALGEDLQAAAIQVGKALADPVRGMTALRRVGILLSRDQEKHIKTLVKQGKLWKAQKIILGELSREFGGSARASADTFGGAMRRMGDAVEEAQKSLATALLPALTEFARWIAANLKDEKTQAAIRSFGTELAEGARKLITWLRTIDFGKVGDMLRGVRDAARTIVDAFLGLPEWVKVAVLTGWGVNKLSGGLLGAGVGNIAGGLGGLAKELFGRGSSPAHPMWVATTGGFGGRAGASAVGAARGGLASAVRIIGGVTIAADTIGALAELITIRNAQSAENAAQAQGLGRQTGAFVQVAGLDDLKRSLSGIEQYTAGLNSNLTPEAIAFQLNIDGVRDAIDATKASLRAQIARLEATAARDLQRLSEDSRSGASRIVTATLRGAAGIASDSRSETAAIRAASAAQATRLASLRDAVERQRLSAVVTVKPQPITLKLDGRRLASAVARYTSNIPI